MSSHNLAKGRLLLLVGALMFTAIFGVFRVEPAQASGGCCAVATCYFLSNTCASEYDCDYLGQCCGGGCF